MSRPILYYFVGYPGAGKTTISEIIHKQTGAKHIWADQERNRIFANPTHSEEESRQLYEKLNTAAEYLLSNGKSVIYDTNFNYANDRQKMRDIAAEHGAEAILIWVTTPKNTAKKRAVHPSIIRNGYDYHMSSEEFEKIVKKLQKPSEDEKAIKIDATKFDEKTVERLLNRHE